MSANTKLPEMPMQLLKPEAYISEKWLEREYVELFGKTWHFACTMEDLPNAGDYVTKKVGRYLLLLVRDHDGELRAYHNICRHRGTELLEGSGNAGKTIVCPYHRWTFDLGGELRGLPDQATCFPGLDKKEHGLLPASVGEVGKLVFVHPAAEPEESFENWIADVPDHVWPHDISSPEMVPAEGELVYEMQCNWKVFYENAIDGYHLAYLHENTLGGPEPSKNVWDVHGRHLIWYSTERDGKKNRNTMFTEAAFGNWEHGMPHVGEPGYGGVYMLFPSTIISASPISFAVATLEPVSAGVTHLRARAWSARDDSRFPTSPEQIPGFDPESGLVKSSHWTVHPLESGDFQTEDVWIVEKMQRALESQAYTTAATLARGAGAEAPLAFFQQQVLDFMKRD